MEEVAETVRGLVPRDLGPLRIRERRWAVKVWFGPEKPTREHYEAQVLGAKYVEDATVLAIEVGFHAENRDVTENDAVIERILGSEKKWRRVLGKEAEVGPFIGRPDDWRRISETWADPDLGDPDLPFELGARLADYVTCIEPLRRG